MTTERDFDRLARAWLELGPDEAPDRVVAAVLQAAETTPQVRRPLRWPLWRSFPMTRLPLAAGAVAILVVLVGGVLVMQNNRSGVGSPSTPSSSPSSSASFAGGAVPESIRSTWVADVDPIPGLGAADKRIRLVMDATGTNQWLRLDTSDTASMNSSLAQAGANELTVSAISTGAGCNQGDAGRYRWTVSGDGATLTLASTNDACATRSTALQRTWVRDLVADHHGGRGVVAAFDPAFLVTLPDGTYDGTAHHDSAEIGNNSVDASLFAVKDPWGLTQPCSNTVGGAKKPIAPGADAFVAYIRSLPGFTVQTKELKVDGHRAVHLDVTTSASIDCPGGTLSEWTAKADTSGTAGVTWNIAPGNPDTLTIVELPTATYLLQYLGGYVTKTAEQDVLSTVKFIDVLPTQP